MKPALFGGVVGGIVSVIPVIGQLLVCCFCLPTLGGSALAVWMYLKDRPNERLTTSDAALCGSLAGVVAGVLGAILGYFVNLAFGALSATVLQDLYGTMPDFASQVAVGGFGLLISIPLSAIVDGAMGALGGFLAMQLFFKDRLAQ